MTETPCTFGAKGELFGVACLPATPSQRRTGLLLSNAGLIHHCGPQALYTELSRRVAARGVHALRFDLGGIGDSYNASQSTRYEERAVEDLTAAMDHLAHSQGVERFVLAGICSGADDAHRATVADPRVVGVVQIDGYAYPTPGFYARHYGSRLLDPKAYTNRVRKLVGGAPQRASESAVELNYRSFRTREEYARDLDLLNARNVQQLFIYTRSWRERCNYREQMRDAFGPERCHNLRVELFPRADHMFLTLSQRRGLLELLESWVAERV